MVGKKKKRPHMRKKEDQVGIIGNREQVELETFKKESQKIADKFVDGVKDNNRETIQQVLNEREDLSAAAIAERRRKDKQLRRDAFISLSPATAGKDERLVDAAMAAGTSSYDKHYNDTPEVLQDLSSTDLEPEKVQKITFDLIHKTQLLVRKNDGKSVDSYFADALPVTDDKVILELFNLITPQNEAHLKADIAKFYEFVSYNSTDPNIDNKLIGPALARSYVDYVAILKSTELRNTT